MLRGLIDKNREQGRKSAQFLLLGSASIDLLRQSSESLAGRISYLELSGFNALEVGENKNNLQKLWLRGGFPDSYLVDPEKSIYPVLEAIESQTNLLIDSVTIVHRN